MKRIRRSLRDVEHTQPNRSTSQHAVTQPEATLDTATQQVLAMQRTHGNRYTQAYLQRQSAPPQAIQRDPAKDKADLEQAVYGVQMMLYHGASGGAGVPKSVPDDYQAAVAGLREAVTNHQGRYVEDKPQAEQAIRQRYEESYGVIGTLIFNGFKDQLVLREQVASQTKAVSAWRVAYPAIQDLLGKANAAGINTRTMSSTLGRPPLATELGNWNNSILDRQVELSTQLIPLPDFVEDAENYFKAKEAVAKLDDYYSRSKAVLGEVSSAYRVRKEQMGLHKLMGEEDFAKAHALEAKAIAVVKWAKAITSTPDSFSKAMKEYEKGNNFKGTLGIASASKGFLSDVALPVVNFGVDVSERVIASRQWTTATTVGHDYSSVIQINKLKSGIAVFEKGLGTVGAVLDLVGGIMELSDGINANDFDAIVGGSLSVTTGVIGLADLALGTSAGSFAAPFVIQAKAIAHVLSETTKMWAAMHHADMKDHFMEVVAAAQTAAESTGAFMIAAEQHDTMAGQNSDNSVDQDLMQRYQDTAIQKAHTMIKSSANFVGSLYDGKLGDFDVVRQSFDQGVGGTGAGATMRTKLDGMADTAQALKGKPDSTNQLIQMGHELGEIMPKIGTGVAFVGQSLGGFIADNATTRLFGPDQTHDSLELQAYWVPGEEQPYIMWRTGDFSVKSPIYDNNYHQKVYDRHKGKSLQAVKGIPINVHIQVRGGTLTLHFVDGVHTDTTFPSGNDKVYAHNAYDEIIGRKAGLDLSAQEGADALSVYFGAFLKNTTLPSASIKSD